GGVPSTLVPGDITDFDMIDQMGAAIYERFGKLDVLVGNAAMLGQLSPLGHIDPKKWDQVMAVNLTANWRLVRSLDSLLRQSDAGRVIFVTSSVGHVARAYWGAYAISKAGLEMLANIYAEETKKSNVRVNLINPGGTRTAMRAEAMPGEDPETVKPPEELTEYFVELAETSCAHHGEMIGPK
ncbi:MAG: SDR family NAD(P)-dependent oxidoreductase, partial [Rhodospirillaceae bacterium]|nr:SDR family NAD(P)-dependent oxidoreductase [Rhodospirillaceae bacterium]